MVAATIDDPQPGLTPATTMRTRGGAALRGAEPAPPRRSIVIAASVTVGYKADVDVDSGSVSSGCVTVTGYSAEDGAGGGAPGLSLARLSGSGTRPTTAEPVGRLSLDLRAPRVPRPTTGEAPRTADLPAPLVPAQAPGGGRFHVRSRVLVNRCRVFIDGLGSVRAARRPVSVRLLGWVVVSRDLRLLRGLR